PYVGGADGLPDPLDPGMGLLLAPLSYAIGGGAIELVLERVSGLRFAQADVQPRARLAREHDRAAEHRTGIPGALQHHQYAFTRAHPIDLASVNSKTTCVMTRVVLIRI